MLADIAATAPGMTVLERTVNGQTGLVAQQDGVTVTVLAFEIAGDRIMRIWAVRNPDKLRSWTLRGTTALAARPRADQGRERKE